MTQMLKNDGDIVRGLGFVTLYSAYLEEQVDKLLFDLGPLEDYDEQKQRWQISRKLKHAQQLLLRLRSEELDELAKALDFCLGLFERRNELVHGRIYASFNRPDTLLSGRPNVPQREICAEELYQLANDFWELRSVVYRPTIFKLNRALAKYEDGIV